MAARMLQIPLPENPAWWELFDATKPRKSFFCNGYFQCLTKADVFAGRAGRDCMAHHEAV